MRSPAATSLVWLVLFGASQAAAQSPQNAADYPQRPIRIVVGFAPGGTTDILSRLVAAHLTQTWGKQVVVDNRPGASAQIATSIVAKANPDGYTLLVTPSGTHTINPSLYSKLPYDTLQDIAPVSLMAWVTNLVITHPSTSINSLQDLIRLAKARPGQLTYASSGSGTIAHLSGEVLKSLVGIDLVHVPYKGGGPALAAVASNEVTAMFAALPSATPFVQAKRIIPIVVTSPKRSPALPDVPTVIEAGVPGMQVMEWYGLLTTGKTPRPVIEKLNTEVAKILNKPDVQAQLIELGAQPVGGSVRDFATQIESDIQMWSKVVKKSAVRAD